MVGSIRERVIEAAVEVTTTSGWASVTMAGLADRVGVSRQTVYNEIGSKPALAEAMIHAELAQFLGRVSAAFDDEPDDLQAAIERAVADVLSYAEDNRLLHAVVSATHGADTELLPLLTTHAQSLLDAAKAVVGERIAAYDVALAAPRLEAAIDMVVRVVLSHIMAPSGPPARTASDLAWLAGRVVVR